MIARLSASKLLQLATDFKAVVVTGARQAGKTTLVKELFKDKPYVSLENPDQRGFALEDPRGFLATYPGGAILDEVQRTPEIFSYLQEMLDDSNEKGLFILTGSNNFLLQQNISQSLAGRVGFMNLPTFSIEELEKGGIIDASDDTLMWKGFYPPVYDQSIPPNDWYPNYVRTYIERDVRQIRNITDLLVFERFLKLLAGRSGQELNYSALAVEAGVDVKTIQSWIGILESSFIVHLLPPYHRNFNKTVVKRPKLYLSDTGLLCHLLGIREPEHLTAHPLRGAVFETMVVNELVKTRMQQGLSSDLTYWREKTGHEIDIVMERKGMTLPVEIKSGQTIGGEFFKNLKYWARITGLGDSFVLYAGAAEQRRSDGCIVMPWRKGVSALH
jgi:predicted AAA+ superfamily ATPase